MILTWLGVTDACWCPPPSPTHPPHTHLASLTQAQSGYNQSRGHFWSGAGVPSIQPSLFFFYLDFQSVSKQTPSETHAHDNQAQQLDLLTFQHQNLPQPSCRPLKWMPSVSRLANRLAAADEGRRGEEQHLRAALKGRQKERKGRRRRRR